jgi:hypothetical protein
MHPTKNTNRYNTELHNEAYHSSLVVQEDTLFKKSPDPISLKTDGSNPRSFVAHRIAHPLDGHNKGGSKPLASSIQSVQQTYQPNLGSSRLLISNHTSAQTISDPSHPFSCRHTVETAKYSKQLKLNS